MIVASLMAGGVALAVGPGAPGTSGTASAPDFWLTVSPARLVVQPGPIDTSVRVGGLRAPDFVISGPVEFGATVENVGTVRRDFFGEEGLKVEVNGCEIPFPDFTVLPGTSRDVTVRWTDPPLMCACHAKVSVTGSDGTSSRSATVVVFPLHLFVMLLSLSGALYLLALWARRRCQACLLGIVREARDPD
ncbi:hypothetical protein [Streptosporangium roseum]|uniref:hypothetical protein n=1 Tax=Streptosporangium roseum TaxID=2001 RepID=UPI00068EBF46|nr:hypothetical protein [Streptosporangium roseum]